MQHNQEYYDKEFVCLSSSITRGDLESMPCPFCTENVSDETMQQIIQMTDTETKVRLGIADKFWLNLGIDRVSETWWEELEKAVRHYNIPYYEDLPENETEQN